MTIILARNRRSHPGVRQPAATRPARSRALALAALAGLLAASLAGPACKRTPSRAPTLTDLKVGDELKASGRWLMSVPEGLNRLDSPPRSSGEVIVAVHGYESEGYEWVYPLQRFGESGARIYFYRWDYEQCPTPGASGLASALTGLLASDPGITRVTVFGHSYGGLITALMASTYRGAAGLDAHTIAAPLAGMSAITGRCDFTGVNAPDASAPVRLWQWRTRKELDGAYRDLDTDPQVVDLPGEVTVLPEEYQGNRLGHNRSISWVADQVREHAGEAAETGDVGETGDKGEAGETGDTGETGDKGEAGEAVQP